MQRGSRAKASNGEGTGRSSGGGARTSLRQVLWGLVLALALPTILVAAAGFYSNYRAEQQAIYHVVDYVLTIIFIWIDPHACLFRCNSTCYIGCNI